ncbi:MAG: hypothetical protein AB8F65_11045 [Woeseiaceae bacterium]
MNTNNDIDELAEKYRRLSAPVALRLPSPEPGSAAKPFHAGLIPLMAALIAIVALVVSMNAPNPGERQGSQLVAQWSIATPESSADLSSIRTRLSAPVSLETPRRPAQTRDVINESTLKNSSIELNEKD